MVNATTLSRFTQLAVLYAACLASACVVLVMADVPRRGLYLSLYASQSPSLYSYILGDTPKEDALFRYCRTRGVNALSLYNLHVILPSMATDLRTFITRARREAGIRWVEAIAATTLSKWVDIASYQNASTTDDEMFDGAVTEIEYWQDAGKPVDDMLEPVRYMKSLYPRARRDPARWWKSRFYYASYIGWPDYGQIKNEMAADLDLLLIHAYRTDPNSAYGYVEPRVDELFEADKLEYALIYSSESVAYSAGSEHFMGDWLAASMTNTVQSAEEEYRSQLSANVARRSNQNRFTGFTYFTYTYSALHDTDAQSNGPYLQSDPSITWKLLRMGATWQNAAWCVQKISTGSWTECQNVSRIELKEEVVVVDLFNVSAGTIAALKTREVIDGASTASLPNRTVVCRFNAGQWESARDDAGDYSGASRRGIVTGSGGAAEWFDIFNSGILTSETEPGLKARMDVAASNGCDAVLPDHVDCWAHSDCLQSETVLDGKAAQISFNQMLAAAAHDRGLAVGLKDDRDQIVDLVGDFDFTVSERCAETADCALLLPFMQADKAVFRTEFTNTLTNLCRELEGVTYGQHVSLLHGSTADGRWYDCESLKPSSTMSATAVATSTPSATPTRTAAVSSTFSFTSAVRTLSLTSTSSVLESPALDPPAPEGSATLEPIGDTPSPSTPDPISIPANTLQEAETPMPPSTPAPTAAPTLGLPTPPPPDGTSATPAPTGRKRKFKSRIRGSAFEELLGSADPQTVVDLANAVTVDLAAALGVPRAHIALVRVSIGSLVVVFTVEYTDPASDGGTVLVDKLTALNASDSSAVFSSVQRQYALYTSAGQHGELIALDYAIEVQDPTTDAPDDVPATEGPSEAACDGVCGLLIAVLVLLALLVVAAGCAAYRCCRAPEKSGSPAKGSLSPGLDSTGSATDGKHTAVEAQGKSTPVV
jgi:hypothetical protein